jgi:hypothetical protein
VRHFVEVALIVHISEAEAARRSVESPQMASTRRIFYSWQSDLGGQRYVIKEALEIACKSLQKDIKLEIRPQIEEDARGKSGAPDIEAEVFAKIDASDVFIGDITFINSKRHADGDRPVPNPNVTAETGYALRALSGERVILVFNVACGDEREVPFDIRNRLRTNFRWEGNSADRKHVKAELAKSLEEKLRPIFTAIELAERRVIRWGCGPEQTSDRAGEIISTLELESSPRRQQWEFHQQLTPSSSAPYLYIGHPSSFGDATIGVGGIEGGFRIVASNVMVATPSGNEPYTLWRSENALFSRPLNVFARFHSLQSHHG